jgi:hypothetical protein
MILVILPIRSGVVPAERRVALFQRVKASSAIR